MVKRQLLLMLTLLVVVPLVVIAQKASVKAKEARWEGGIERSYKVKSTLTVRKSSGNFERGPSP